jgi:hypothetical protein
MCSSKTVVFEFIFLFLATCSPHSFHNSHICCPPPHSFSPRSIFAELEALAVSLGAPGKRASAMAMGCRVNYDDTPSHEPVVNGVKMVWQFPPRSQSIRIAWFFPPIPRTLSERVVMRCTICTIYPEAGHASVHRSSAGLFCPYKYSWLEGSLHLRPPPA